MSLLHRIRGKEEKPSAGFHTAIQWAKKWGLGAAHTRVLLRRGINAGVIVCRLFRIRRGVGLYPTPHYAEVKKGKRRPS